MARVARLAGAILAETEGHHYLVGNTKRPCDWPSAGFEVPAEIDALKRPYIAIASLGPVALEGSILTLDVEGRRLAQRLADCFVIPRTGSVSERLWSLVVGGQDDEPPPSGPVDARWLGDMPMRVWQVVQDTVLRCV